MKVYPPFLPTTSSTDQVFTYEVVTPSMPPRQRHFGVYTSAPTRIEQTPQTLQLTSLNSSHRRPPSHFARCPDEIQLQILKAASLTPIALLKLAQIDGLRIHNAASDNVLWAQFFPRPDAEHPGDKGSICRAFAQRFAQMDVQAQSVLERLWNNDQAARDVILDAYEDRLDEWVETPHGTQTNTTSRAANTVHDIDQAFALFHHGDKQDLHIEDFSPEIRANKEAMLFFLQRHHTPMEIILMTPLSLCCDMQFAALALKRAPKAIDYLGESQRKCSAMRARVGLGPWLPVAQRRLNVADAAIATMNELFFEVRDLYLQQFDELQDEMRT